MKSYYESGRHNAVEAGICSYIQYVSEKNGTDYIPYDKLYCFEYLFVGRRKIRECVKNLVENGILSYKKENNVRMLSFHKAKQANDNECIQIKPDLHGDTLKRYLEVKARKEREGEFGSGEDWNKDVA